MQLLHWSQVQANEAKKSFDLIVTTTEEVQTRQRDMSREVIEPTVRDAMTDAYAACCAEVGSGQYDRMRRRMRAAVEQQKDSMFQEAAGDLLLILVFSLSFCCAPSRH